MSGKVPYYNTVLSCCSTCFLGCWQGLWPSKEKNLSDKIPILDSLGTQKLYNTNVDIHEDEVDHPWDAVEDDAEYPPGWDHERSEEQVTISTLELDNEALFTEPKQLWAPHI